MLIKKKGAGSESNNAGVAKLEDALALGASESNLMEVQVLSPAPTYKISILHKAFWSLTFRLLYAILYI